MIPRNNLIFDFDGVLADTWEVRCQIVCILDSKPYDQVVEESRAFFSAPLFHPESTKAHTKVKEVSSWLVQYQALLEGKEFPLFEGFVSEIAKIPSTRMAIVSSSPFACIEPKLKEMDVTFTHVLGFDHSHLKTEKVAAVCKDWGIDPRKAFYITDTQTDILELELLLGRDHLVGCSWGYQGYEPLRELLPASHILRQFSDIHHLFA